MNLSACPRLPLPASALVQDCKVKWGDIARLVIKHPDGVDPFSGADEATITTAVTTKSTWDAAIALTDDEDALFMTPKANNFELVPGEAQNFEYPDGEIEIVKVGASTATMTFYGLNSANEELLTLLSGGGLDLMFVNSAGQTIGKKAASATETVFFRCSSILGAGRAVNTGTEPDRNILTITFEADALIGWKMYATEAFAKTI